jgi:hypothetical protein
VRAEEAAVVARPGDVILVVMPEGTDHEAAKTVGDDLRRLVPDERIKFVFMHHEYRLMVIQPERT